MKLRLNYRLVILLVILGALAAREVALELRPSFLRPGLASLRVRRKHGRRHAHGDRSRQALARRDDPRRRRAHRHSRESRAQGNLGAQFRAAVTPGCSTSRRIASSRAFPWAQRLMLSIFRRTARAPTSPLPAPTRSLPSTAPRADRRARPRWTRALDRARHARWKNCRRLESRRRDRFAARSASRSRRSPRSPSRPIPSRLRSCPIARRPSSPPARPIKFRSSI